MQDNHEPIIIIIIIIIGFLTLRLFYHIFDSFSKPSESLQTCISMASLHHQSAFHVIMKLSNFAGCVIILYFQACKKNSCLPCWIIYTSLFVDLTCNGYCRINLKRTKHVLHSSLSVSQPHYLASHPSNRINCILTGFEIMQIMAFGQNLQMELQ